MITALGGLYQDIILDHAHRRHGYGLTRHPQVERRGRNPHCGDDITVQLTVTKRDGTVDALHWSGSGCVISGASASMLAAIAPGKTPQGLADSIGVFIRMMHSRGRDDLDYSLLGEAEAFHDVSRYIMRVPCALLAWVTARDCLAELARPCLGDDGRGASGEARSTV